MCLGIPGKVTELTEGPVPMATVDIAGQERACCAMYTPELVVGDWVFIQNGFIMEVLDEEDARQSLETIEEYQLIQHVADNLPRGRTNQ